MPDNRRRHANTVPVAKFLLFALIGITVCAGGLRYVWCKNQMNTIGAQIKKYEGELVQLRSRKEAARTNIAILISTAELDKRFKAGGFKKLHPIPQESLVIMGKKPASSGASELRPVANERKQK